MLRPYVETKIKLLVGVLLSCICLFCFCSSARSDTLTLSSLTPQNLDALTNQTSAEYDALMAQVSKTLLKKFKHERGATITRYTNKEAQLKKTYDSLMEKKVVLDPVHQLASDLEKRFLDTQSDLSSINRADVHTETTRLAIGLFKEIERLDAQFKMFPIPIVHNFLIDTGFKDRGACKHWAEDLLTYLRTVDRKYFDVTWGEANPQKADEHNVAVLIPRGLTFNDGIFIDPWRTSGKAFWMRVTDDHHYPWKQWPDYGVYQ